VQRVRRQVGGVELARRQAADGLAERRRPHARRLEDGNTGHQLDRGGAGRGDRPAARGDEAGIGDLIAFDPQPDPDQVTAERAARHTVARISARRLVTQAARVAQMVGVELGIHAPEDRQGPRLSACGSGRSS
jgi:hypothetical protein